MKIELSSRKLGNAWSAIQIVAPDDDARPVLHRAALVEMFDDHGMRLISTDTYVLVRAWVPFDDEGENLMRLRLGPPRLVAGLVDDAAVA